MRNLIEKLKDTGIIKEEVILEMKKSIEEKEGLESGYDKYLNLSEELKDRLEDVTEEKEGLKELLETIKVITKDEDVYNKIVEYLGE